MMHKIKARNHNKISCKMNSHLPVSTHGYQIPPIFAIKEMYDVHVYKSGH